MGNVSGKRGEEEVESSGVKNQEEEEGGEGEFMECSAQSGQLQLPADPSMVQSPPHTPRAYYSPVIFTPQVINLSPSLSMACTCMYIVYTIRSLSI